MKQLAAKFFLVVYLFSYTPLREVIKMPLLVAHYLYHAEDNPGITVGDFLEMHYGQGITHDADFQHDHQLPFKTTDCNTAPFFVLQNSRLLDIHLVAQKPRKTTPPTAYLFCTSEAQLRGIFHPPKAA